MKNYIPLLFPILITIFLAGCSKDNSDNLGTSPEESNNNIIAKSNDYIPIVLILYEHDAYRGKMRYYVEDEQNLSTGSDFNDVATSAVVLKGPDYDAFKAKYDREPTVTLCEGSAFSGKCITLQIGKYTGLDVYKFNDMASSIKFFREDAVVAPDDRPDNEMDNIHTVVKLFEKYDFQGHYITVLGTNNPAHMNKPYFSYLLANNKTFSSYIVCPGPNSSPNSGVQLLTQIGLISLYGDSVKEGNFNAELDITATQSINP